MPGRAEVLYWEMKEEWVDLPHRGSYAAGGGEDEHCKGTVHNRQSCLSHQIPAAQDSSMESPLLGWWQLRHLRMAWAWSSSVLHLGAAAGTGNARMSVWCTGQEDQGCHTPASQFQQCKVGMQCESKASAL